MTDENPEHNKDAKIKESVDKYDDQGRRIIAENVPIVFGATIQPMTRVRTD